MYRALAKRYGYSPREIAKMTYHQQLMMLEIEANVLTFSDERAYAEWLRTKNV